MSKGSTLTLEREWKFASLVDPPPEGSNRFEASGIVARNRGFIVVFDNVSAVVKLRSERLKANASWIRTSVAAQGFEDISYDPGLRRYFLLVESEPLRNGRYSAVIHQVDDHFTPLVRGRIAVPFGKRNKGFEGLAWTMRGGRGYLLAMLEAGTPVSRRRRKPYRCRICVLRESRKVWKLVAQFKLPRAARLKDYAALAIRGNRLAVVSQESSAVWVGRLHPSRWEVVEDGQVYDFPRDEEDRVVYGNVEGVAWLSSATMAAVSDRASRRRQPSRYRTKDESIHIFRIP